MLNDVISQKNLCLYCSPIYIQMYVIENSVDYFSIVPKLIKKNILVTNF